MNYKTKKSEYGKDIDNFMYTGEERFSEKTKTSYASKKNFARCCKTVSSEPCLCNGQHCMRAF